MKVLFSTKNKAKLKRYKKALEEKGIEIITIKDLNLKLNIDENGKNAIENAYIKAKAYYEATNMPTIGMDDNLYIDEIPEEKQPGTHVRRVNGKELNDDEMKEYGGKVTAKWVYGMVVCNQNGVEKYSWSKDNFYFVDKPSEKRNQGYPLDSISIIPYYNKYLVELTDEEKTEYKNKNNSENAVIEFIENSLR